MKELEQVSEIIDYLQARKWNTYTPDELISAQGALSVLQASIGRAAVDALYEYEIKEQNAKMAETDMYMEVKDGKEKVTEAEAKAIAKQDANYETMEAIKAKKVYKDFMSVLDAMQAIIIACQVTLKQQGKEYGNTGYQRNQ